MDVKIPEVSDPAAGAPKGGSEHPAPAPRKRFPTPGDVFAMLGIVLGAQIVVGLVGNVAMMLGHGIDFDWTSDPALAGRMLCITYLATMLLALAGILLLRRAHGGGGPVAHFARRGLNPALLLWAFALMAAMNILLEPLVARLPGPPYEALGTGFWTAFSLVVLAPLFEETICRGILLGSLRAKYGVTAAWLFSSLFFGVMHVYPAQAVGASVLGLVLGFVYIATDSLWAPIALHAANNAAAYFFMARGYGDAALTDLIHSRALCIAVYIVAAALAAVSAYAIRRTLLRLKASAKKPAEA